MSEHPRTPREVTTEALEKDLTEALTVPYDSWPYTTGERLGKLFASVEARALLAIIRQHRMMKSSLEYIADGGMAIGDPDAEQLI
jgi:hypothetical protein